MSVSTVDATAKGASSNSFVTLANANQYFEDRPGNSDWTGATTDARNQALLHSTKMLDKLYRWRGERTTTTQSLSWPRQYVPDPDPDLEYKTGAVRLRLSYIDEDVIPNRIAYATYEQALSLIQDSARMGDPGLQQFNRLKIEGVLDMEVNSNKLSRPISRSAKDFIQPFLRMGGQPYLVRR